MRTEYWPWEKNSSHGLGVTASRGDLCLPIDQGLEHRGATTSQSGMTLMFTMETALRLDIRVIQ